MRLPTLTLAGLVVASSSAIAQVAFDVVVYGGTPAGVIATTAAGRQGMPVLL